MSKEEKSKPFVSIWRGHPFLKGQFADDNTLFTAGFDRAPVAFKKSGDKWEDKLLDSGLNEERKSSAESWKDKEMQSDVKLDDIVLTKEKNTKHTNTIVALN